jgi:hypothetical protein
MSAGKLLDDSEKGFFDCINQELNELSGCEVNYYAYSTAQVGDDVARVTTKVDPLYGEATERQIAGPFRVFAQVKWPSYEPVSDEGGFGRTFDCEITISRAHLDEQGLPYPSEGDIIEMWRTPYHDDQAKGKGLFFDVLKAWNDGHINDTPTFTQFKMNLKRRTQFGAERRITPP